MYNAIKQIAPLIILTVLGMQNSYAKIEDQLYIDKHVQNGEILSQSFNGRSSQEEKKLHLFTHGRSGELFIDGEWLNVNKIANWLSDGNRLKGKSALAIYGCEFAKGKKGREAVSYLTSTLGIPVAASNDITGKDGDWELEVGEKLSVIEPLNYPSNLQYIRITPDMFDITNPIDGYSNGTYQDISSHLGLSPGSVRVRLMGIDVKASSRTGVLKFSLTNTGNHNSFYRFRLDTPRKIRVAHGSQLNDFSTDEIVSGNNEPFNFLSTLDTGLSHSQVGNAYRVYNSSASSIRNSTGRFLWEAVNPALEFDIRVLNDSPTSDSDHLLFIDDPATTPTNPVSCPVNPKFVFILDDSDSIDNIERAEMQTSLQNIADKIELNYPNAEFGVIQYGTPPNPTTPEAGTYNIVMNYTINPIFSITDNPAFTEDHLPDSIDQMITDNIFTTGALSNPDAFFIFTNALRDGPNGGVCCSNLENTVHNVSSDAESGFGEYSKLATLASTGNVSLYQVLPGPRDASPGIVQGNGVHHVGSFTLPQNSIDSIGDSLCSTTPPTVPNYCAAPPRFENPVLESGVNKQVSSVYRFSDITTGVDALLEILDISTAIIGDIDKTGTGSGTALQAELMQDQSAGAAIPDQHVDFEIRFVEAGTNTPYTFSSFVASAVDIDGDGYGTREYTILPNASSYTLETPTNLTSPSAGRFTSIDNTNVPGILVTNTESRVTANYNNISSLRYTTGFTNDNGADYDSFHRLSSLDFQCVTYNNPQEPANISGIVFEDVNTNDTHEAAEAGLANISVSLYDDLNGNGTIDVTDTLISTINSDANGEYSFPTVVDGNYLVEVDDNDSDLVAVDLGGTNPLAVTISGSSITDVNFPFDPMVCTALSDEISEAALLSPASINSGDLVIVPSTSVTPNEIQGHLRAYELDSKGLPKAKAKWDADDKMTKQVRQSGTLYSAIKQGETALASFTSLDATLFGTSSDAANVIKQYTINPSDDNGKYLAGRKSGSFLGRISRHNGIALLDNEIDTFKYLDDKDYQTYYPTYVKSRDEKVLIGSDDGFLYSFDYQKGDLDWGWMPSSLVKELKNYATFQSNKYMRGQIDTIDLASSSGYDPYVVGTYKGGLGHYVLKLDKASSSKSNLKSVVWESDESNNFVSSPNRGQIEYFTDEDGVSYITYIMTDNSAQSTLFIRSLTDSNTLLKIPLNINVSSTPFIMYDFKKHNAPERKTLYLGDQNGNLYSAPLLSSNGSLESGNSIKASLENGKIEALASSDTDPVSFIGASVSIANNQYYLRAQSASRLSVFKYDSSSKTWKRQWTTAVQDSEKVNSDGSVTSNPSDIQVLPVGAKITDNAYIVSDSIVLPVNEVDPNSPSCVGKGYYYLYKLNDGSKPKKTFFAANNNVITGNIYLGYGSPTSIEVGDIPHKNTLAAYGHTDQKDDGTTGVSQTVFIKDHFTTGVRSWRVIND